MNNDNNIAITLLANAIGQQAARPQKSSVYTTTTTTPYARPDMIMRRDTIGPSRQNLVDTLRKREDAGYSIANTLASMPQQQGYGSWLGDFARSFGGTLKAPTDAQIARAQADYDAEQKDLAMALAYDKAMGDTQTQVQNIGYDDVAGAGGSGGAGRGEFPILSQDYWNTMIHGFDKARPTEADYRAQTQLGRKLSNATTFAGDAEENYARANFQYAKEKQFLPMARGALKGSGPITDFEDQKYTSWISAAQDPVQLKDVAVRIADDVMTKNNWTKEQKAAGYSALGLTSAPNMLLDVQKRYEPERVGLIQKKPLVVDGYTIEEM